MSVKDSLIGLLIVFIWGFNFVVIAWGVNDLPPLLMGAARFILVAFIGSLFVRKPDIPWRWMALYAITLCFGQFAFLFSAIAFGMPAGIASIVLQSQVIFTLIFSVLLLNETIRSSQLISMCLSGIGLYIIGVAGQQNNMTGIGFALSIAAAVAWGAGNVINRMINQRGYHANLGLVVWSSWISLVPFILSSLYFEGTDIIWHSLINMSWSTFAVLMYLAFAASITGYSLWSYLLTHYPAGQVAPLTLGIPVVGLLSASYFLHESISTKQYLGVSLVMFGLFVNLLGSKISRLLYQIKK